MKKIILLFAVLITSFSFGQNLLTNGDFEQGATNWAGNAFNAVDDGSGTNMRNEANVATAGNPWDVSLNQPLSLTAGTTYVLSYIAYTDATTGTRSMTAGIGRNEPDWAALTSNPALTATPTTFTYTYTVNYPNPATSRVVFDMGAETGYVFIDDVVMAFILSEQFSDKTNGLTFYIGSGEGIALKDAFQAIIHLAAKITGKIVSCKHVKPPDNLSEIEFRDAIIDSSAFTNLTGWKPRYSFTEGLDIAYKNYFDK